VSREESEQAQGRGDYIEMSMGRIVLWIYKMGEQWEESGR
jgi:hypothetical protein